MEIFTDRTNSKSLNLDGFDEGVKKVTVGFKCHPKLKLQLSNEAKDRGLTLSEYVENLLLTLEENKGLNQKQLDDLKNRIAFYENDILLNFYKKYRGQEIRFNTADGDSMLVKINEPKDIYTVLINSFKSTDD
jgi:hypothetical protein